MAAAALLRSMARKLARAPPPNLLARSGPGASLTSNQIRQVSGDPLVVGAGLRSLATKIARASPQPHQPRLLTRRLHTGGTPPPTTDKDKIIERLRSNLRLAKAVTGIGAVVLYCLTEFWVLPHRRQMRDKCEAYERLLLDLLRGADEDGRVALVDIIQTAGHMKQQRNGTTEEGVDMLAIHLMEDCLDILKEAKAVAKETRADIDKETQAAVQRTTELANSKFRV